MCLIAQVTHAYMSPCGVITPEEWQTHRQSRMKKEPELQREAEELAMQINKEACTDCNASPLIHINDFLSTLAVAATDPCKYIKQIFSYNCHQDVITDEAIFDHFLKCLQKDRNGFVLGTTDVILAQKLAQRGYRFKPEEWADHMQHCRMAVVDGDTQRRKVADYVADIMSASMVAQEEQAN